MADCGHMYARLAEAVRRSGTPRSVYSQDTTLSRRGLLTRADRRARELGSAGVRAGDVVALSMGNVAEFLVLMLATSKIGAVAMPIDPSQGDRPLFEAAERLPLRAVIRRPRGLDPAAIEYPPTYVVRSRKRLTSSLLTLDVLEPPAALRDLRLPANAELIIEARGIGGVLRDTVRCSEHLEAIGRAAASALGLDEGVRLLCAQPLTSPRYLDAVVLGWLASEAQLVMAEGPSLLDVIPIARTEENLVVVDSVRQFTELARALKASSRTLEAMPVLPQATVPLPSGRPMKQAFGHSPRQLLSLEEIGVLASRVMERGSAFEPAPGVELRTGTPMEVGGHEILVRTSQVGLTIPRLPEDEPGSPADDDGFLHTGYAGKFTKRGLVEVLGRDDGLVNLEGRRACLDNIEDQMLEHRRITWVRAYWTHTEGGDPEVHLEYRATGETALDDIEEHAVGHLPPFMVPRAFERLS
jgi:acyl-CoA synthetase (AMP-forming)/AMP-acid ligase II